MDTNKNEDRTKSGLFVGLFSGAVDAIRKELSEVKEKVSGTNVTVHLSTKESPQKNERKDASNIQTHESVPIPEIPSPTQLESEMRTNLNRRNQLEDRILSFIGGKTGMSVIWDEILHCALAGDRNGFLFFAGSFPQKADILRKDFEELMSLIQASKKLKETFETLPDWDKCPGTEVARLSVLPYRYEEECKKLLENSARLVESRLLDQSKAISKADLLAWGNQFITKEDENNERADEPDAASYEK